MSKTFSVLLDAPSETTSRMPLAILGEYEDKRYGKFPITKEEVVDWKRNLSQLPGGRAPIDEDHASNRVPRRTEASGWITGISLEGKQAWADVEWTPKGKSAIEEKRYLFASPTFGPYTNDKGETFENTLSAAALTNRPYLTSMPMITLASDDIISRALEMDPASAFYQRALDGELGAEAQSVALAQPSPEDEVVTTAISNAAKAVAKAIQAQKDDPDKTDPNDESVLASLRSAASALDRAEHAQARDVKGEKPRLLELDESGAILLDTLTAGARNDLKDSDFALSGRRYPIHDVAHARNALAHVAQNGDSDEQAKVKAAVYRRYPDLKPSVKKLDKSDNRGQMKFSADTVKSLAALAGVTDEAEVAKLVELATADGAEESKVLEAIEAARPAPGPVKTLEEQAAEAGKAVVSVDEQTALSKKASDAEAALAAANKQLEAAGNEPVKTLEEQAAEAGKALVDEPRLKTLEDAAAKVPGLEVAVKQLADERTETKKELADNKFDAAYGEAERLGKAVPANKDRMKAFFELDAENTLTMLSEAPVVVNVKPQGRNVPAPADNVPDGTHAQHYELEQQIATYMEEQKVDYFKALEAVGGVKVPGMVD